MEPPEDDLDADGDPAPASKEKVKKRLNRHLNFARKHAKYDRKNKVRNVQRELQRINTKNAQDKLETLKDLTDLTTNKTNIADSTLLHEAKTFYPELIAEKKVIWEPFPGPQTNFLEADEFEVLFSGGRAPGKSDALLIDPLRYCYHKDFRGLMIRKAMPDLRDLIKRAKELYPLAYPGTRWKEQEKLFIFPSGAVMEFGYCDHEDDVARYQGQEYTWLGVDELTQIASEEIYEKLILTVRKRGEGLKNYVRSTTNPNGPGKMWVKRRFVDMGMMGKTITLETYIPRLNQKITTTRKWIHGTVFDNPKVVAENPAYIAMLQNIDNAVLRAQWLEGDWDSAEGLAFDEFERKVHVVETFKVPEPWYKFRAADWGYKTKAACLWMAVDFDGNIFVYRELITTKVLAKDFGAMIKEREAAERIRYGVLDVSAWSQRGENAPPPAEDMAGLTWRPSDRGPHSRKTGKLQVHNFLQKNPLTGKPSLFIMDCCPDLIKGLSSLPSDKTDPEDVDTNADDHSYDALRYGLSSRPRMGNNYSFGMQQAQQADIINPQFGF